MCLGGLTLLKKLVTIRGIYPHGPELHVATMQERDKWANMMLRYTKDENTHRKIKQERPRMNINAKRAGNYF